ncbi:MAG: hypothetical protein C4K58_02440 [Flavobacteriaceae bacterium]|nr:MAG: hypothetical protein C4K58_02440 [Flavobacteriaceae bacterium]
MKPNKNLYLIALSYKKADVEIRGKYAFFPSKVKSFVMAAKKYNIKSMYVLSTCNRTEFYAFAEDPKDMISLYASEHALGSVKELEEHVEVLQGREVVEHLIRVAAGLESQILGDFEIVSQIKIWFGRFQKQGCINVYLERMISSAIQISKKVKNNTDQPDDPYRTCQLEIF